MGAARAGGFIEATPFRAVLISATLGTSPSATRERGRLKYTTWLSYSISTEP